MGNNSRALGTIKDSVGSTHPSDDPSCNADDNDVVALLELDVTDGTIEPLMLKVTSTVTWGPSELSYAELSSRYTKQPTVELLP